LFERASRPRLVFPITMTSADFSGADARKISPGNDTLLCRTAAAFTSTGIPDDFVVLCQLIAPCRPSMQFLSISSQRSPSLPSRGRSPFHSWPQIVVSSFSCSGIPTGDLNPIYNVPMLGTHKTRHRNRHQPPCRSHPVQLHGFISGSEFAPAGDGACSLTFCKIMPLPPNVWAVSKFATDIL
jgi:hypothetical protein